MGKVYVGQVLEITLDTEVDLSTATDPIIRAFPPSGASREWSATVSGTTLKYTTIKDTDLNLRGEWRFQAEPNIDGAEAPGETVWLTVYSLGN